jgi:hypothetical protein
MNNNYINYIKSEITNNKVLFLLNSRFYYEDILIKNIDNIIKITKYDMIEDKMLLYKLCNLYSYKNNKKIILITDSNLLSLKKIKHIISKVNSKIKIIFAMNGNNDKIIKKLNKKNIIIKDLKEYNIKITKYDNYKINDDKLNSNSIELYNCCNNILLSDCSNLDELYNIFLTEKVYIPLTINTNYYKYTTNDEIILEYLDLYSYSDQIQDYIFKDGYKELEFLYFIITCIIPSLLLKGNLKKNISKKLDFTNIISYTSLIIINKNKYYNTLRNTKLQSIDDEYIKDKIIEINNNKTLMKIYDISNQELDYFINYFNLN